MITVRNLYRLLVNPASANNVPYGKRRLSFIFTMGSIFVVKMIIIIIWLYFVLKNIKYTYFFYFFWMTAESYFRDDLYHKIKFNNYIERHLLIRVLYKGNRLNGNWH